MPEENDVIGFPSLPFMNTNQGLFLAGIFGVLFFLVASASPLASEGIVLLAGFTATVPFLSIIYRLLGDSKD